MVQKTIQVTDIVKYGLKGISVFLFHMLYTINSKRTKIPSTDYFPWKTRYTDLVSASVVMKLSLHKAITLEFYNILY